jgi:hypothetical protein
MRLCDKWSLETFVIILSAYGVVVSRNLYHYMISSIWCFDYSIKS